MKKCFKCEAVKPLNEFYKHPQMADGRVNKCKECNKNDVTNNRNKNIDRIRRYDRDRGNRQSKAYLDEYRNRYPNKYRSHQLVSRAIRSGNLFSKPCVNCGEVKTHAHHDNYLEPLNVTWFCAACHKSWHGKNGEGLNGS